MRSQKMPRRGVPSPGLFLTLMTVLALELAVIAYMTALMFWGNR